MNAGLVKLGHVALDGTKLKADASKHKAMSYGRMEQVQWQLLVRSPVGLIRPRPPTRRLEPLQMELTSEVNRTIHKLLGHAPRIYWASDRNTEREDC